MQALLQPIGLMELPMFSARAQKSNKEQRMRFGLIQHRC